MIIQDWSTCSTIFWNNHVLIIPHTLKHFASTGENNRACKRKFADGFSEVLVAWTLFLLIKCKCGFERNLPHCSGDVQRVSIENFKDAELSSQSWSDLIGPHSLLHFGCAVITSYPSKCDDSIDLITSWVERPTRRWTLEQPPWGVDFVQQVSVNHGFFIVQAKKWNFVFRERENPRAFRNFLIGHTGDNMWLIPCFTFQEIHHRAVEKHASYKPSRHRSFLRQIHNRVVSDTFRPRNPTTAERETSSKT